MLFVCAQSDSSTSSEYELAHEWTMRGNSDKQAGFFISNFPLGVIQKAYWVYIVVP